MDRELTKGDLVIISAKNLSPEWLHYSEDGLLGIVVDDIDAHEEVRCYHVTGNEVSFRWWNTTSVELLSESR
jgi:hypothetical protein